MSLDEENGWSAGKPARKYLFKKSNTFLSLYKEEI
jgi:hypothetical protein